MQRRDRGRLSLLSLSFFSSFLSLSLFLFWSLSLSCNVVGDLSFPCLSIPQSHLLRLSLVGSKAVSQRRSYATREIPRTRYEFTFLLLYSTLACPPFCLLEPLVYLADLRLPYVSAARLISLVPLSLSLRLSFSLSFTLSACIRA